MSHITDKVYINIQLNGRSSLYYNHFFDIIMVSFKKQKKKRGVIMANKSDLINLVAEKAELSKKDAGNAVDAVFTSIQDLLSKGEKVQLIGFGNFEVRERAGRMGRNPQTGKEVEIKATKVPAFKAGKTLKEVVK